MASRDTWYSAIANILMILIVIRGGAQAVFAYSETGVVLPVLQAFSLIIFSFVGLLFLAFLLEGQVALQELVAILFLFLWMLLVYVVTGNFSISDFLVYLFPFLLVVGMRPFSKCLSWRFFVFICVSVFLVQIFLLISNGGIWAVVAREGRGQLGALFGHANSFAVVVAAFVVLIWFRWAERNLFSFWLWLGVFILFLIGARSMIIAVLMIVVLSSFLNPMSREYRVGLLIAFVCVTAMLVQYGTYLLDQDWDEQSISSGNSLKWRLVHWSYYLQDFNKLSDVLLGFGLGSHEHVTEYIYNKYFEVHNDWLRVVYDIGVVGLFLYMITDLVIYRRLKDECAPGFVFSVLLVKYFFMFFDNMVGNMMTILGFYFIILVAMGGGDEKRNHYCEY